MQHPVVKASFLLTLLFALIGCTAWQPTKEVWKTTKGLWNTYISPPATVDYDDKGSSPPEAISLSQSLMGVDMELGKLERVMQNADRPPTQEWLTNLFSSFPWLSGFAGVKYDGQILGQEPPDSMKQLDFIPLLYEDKKQNSRALRADVQLSPLGPEVMLATPLYDGVDFLGIVVAYFDMRSLMRFSDNAADIVVLCPQSLLWPGKYEYAATPLAGVDWNKVVRESSSGTCTNSTGTFYYMVRYLGNLPLVFAIPSHGTFPEGSGTLEQASNYFPQEREKLPPPPVPERKNTGNTMIPAFQQPEPEPEPAPTPPPAERNVIQQGSRESMLLKKQQQAARRRQIQERLLDEPPMPAQPPKDTGPRLGLLPEEASQTEALPGGRPSPFGPKQTGKPSPFGPSEPGAPPESEYDSIPEVRGPASTEPLARPEVTEPATSTGPEIKPGVSSPARSEAPAAEPQATSKPEAMTNSEAAEDVPRLADGEKAPTTDEAPQAPRTLPGGRPSPFGPK